MRNLIPEESENLDYIRLTRGVFCIATINLAAYYTKGIVIESPIARETPTTTREVMLITFRKSNHPEYKQRT